MPPVFDKDTKYKVIEYGSDAPSVSLFVIIKTKISNWLNRKK